MICKNCEREIVKGFGCECSTDDTRLRTFPSGRGGERRGAGRPVGTTKPNNRQQITITLPKPMVKIIDEKPGSRARVIEQTVTRLECCEELLKHATDLVDRMDDDTDVKWVMDETDKYFQHGRR